MARSISSETSPKHVPDPTGDEQHTRNPAARTGLEGKFHLRASSPDDRSWVKELLADHWGSAQIVTRGVIHQADQLPGFVAAHHGKPSGLVTYHIDGEACEIVTLDSLEPDLGIGTALIEAVKQAAVTAGCHRVWLVTTNDNLPALRFYQKRGFRLVALYPNALEKSRELKPEIPLTGLDGIPLRDEIELEYELEERPHGSV